MDYYLNRKKKKNNIRSDVRRREVGVPNAYNQRVDTNVTKQFRHIHNIEKTN